MKTISRSKVRLNELSLVWS